MTTELLMLALSVVLGLVHIYTTSIARTHQYGAQWNVSARDAEISWRRFRCSSPPC